MSTTLPDHLVQLGPFVGEVAGTDQTKIVVYEPKAEDVDAVQWVTARN